MKNIYDWTQIQKDYDEGLSTRDLTNKYGVVKSSIRKAVKRGDFKPRNRSEAAKVRLKQFPQKHTEETKMKISQIRRKFLENNPDKVPYLLNHSSKKTYPEQIFEKALIKKGFDNFIYNYQNGIYQYDFAFVDVKLDVEIDGSTHLTSKVKEIDKRRDEWSVSQGWKVLRFTAKEVLLNVDKCVEVLRAYVESGIPTGLLKASRTRLLASTVSFNP